MSVGRQYFHAKKRSEETTFEYMYCLNIAVIRAKVRIRDGSRDVCRKHVKHFIGMLDDRNASKKLTTLWMGDADRM